MNLFQVFLSVDCCVLWSQHFSICSNFWILCWCAVVFFQYFDCFWEKILLEKTILVLDNRFGLNAYFVTITQQIDIICRVICFNMNHRRFWFLDHPLCRRVLWIQLCLSICLSISFSICNIVFSELVYYFFWFLFFLS